MYFVIKKENNLSESGVFELTRFQNIILEISLESKALVKRFKYFLWEFSKAIHRPEFNDNTN